MPEVADWSNLSALGCLILLILWFATKAVPALMDRWASDAEKARLDFRQVMDLAFSELKIQRDNFREELANQRVDFESDKATFDRTLREQREQLHDLVLSGQQSLNTLSTELREVKLALQKTTGRGDD